MEFHLKIAMRNKEDFPPSFTFIDRKSHGEKHALFEHSSMLSLNTLHEDCPPERIRIQSQNMKRQV